MVYDFSSKFLLSTYLLMIIARVKGMIVSLKVLGVIIRLRRSPDTLTFE